MESEAIRQSFLDFFEAKSHEILASASLMPSSPNLLFTNAGMNAFVPYFLNQREAPYSRITNSQKCIRAGGKHNDLEDVGFDTYHHTFFEMLGNWSIGDYFKKECIEWSWELLTKVWGFPKERLYSTVYKPEEGEPSEFDKEAYEYWEAIFKAEGLDPKIHIHFGNKKDNFWMMGETGPCGPCSEIHIDLTPDSSTKGALINQDSPWCIEIWNLVFIQLNAAIDGTYRPLPQSHIDTGMGFERIAGIIATTKGFTDFSNPPSNYNSDLFIPIFKAIESMSEHRYQSTMPESRTFKNEAEEVDCAFRVISDHIRTLCFSIADGIIPGNEGRNYVLRRILRRAILFGKKLNLNAGFLTKLIPVIVEQLGTAYPELKSLESTIEKVISKEESAFNKTLERGLQLFDKISCKGSITGEEAFTLYDTYGFPYDLTLLIARERKIEIDRKGFDLAMEEQKNRARSAQKKELIETAEASIYSKTNFIGFDLDQSTIKAKIIAVNKIDDDSFSVIVDQTIFYGEMGGQIGDIGTLIAKDGSSYPIFDTQIKDGVILHMLKGSILEKLTIGMSISLVIDLENRKAIQRHHSATHLLNWALRETLGENIKQAGSLVANDRLRFDFSHYESIDSDTISNIEYTINKAILNNSPVGSFEMAFKDIPDDVIAIFGEKYGTLVRIVDIGGFSKELCGGTHVRSIGEIGLFKITSESGIASGTRRIEAVCGESALKLADTRFNQIISLSQKFKCPVESIEDRIYTLINTKKGLEKTLKNHLQKALNEQVKILTEEADTINLEGNLTYLYAVVCVPNSDALKSLASLLSSKLKDSVVVLGTKDEEENKCHICAKLSDSAIQKGYNAGAIVKEICQTLGGSGGGKQKFAMGGVPKTNSLEGILKNYKPKMASS